MNTNLSTTVHAHTRRISIIFVLVVTLFANLMPALAAAPGKGIVYEGSSVPGISLGSTRAEVYKSYGTPTACLSAKTSPSPTCTFPVDGGGTVTVDFKSSFADSGGMLDKVVSVRWNKDVKNWVTTRGITTEIALKDRKAAAAAYPNAVVSYDSKGNIVQVLDKTVGFQIDWQATSAGIQVHMRIFKPVIKIGPAQ